MFSLLYGLSFSVSIIGFCPRFTPNSVFVYELSTSSSSSPKRTIPIGLKNFTNTLFLCLGFDGKQIGFCKIEGKSSNQAKWCCPLRLAL
ncbi:hypothetical protein RchiOBHm_Chr1g0369161 [Rosa chinensis]|uniref:Secreted protein n=1 Tax=Rosa chinensis TaxID=74649 RepID=A0A2P6SKZ4_ROSCH|nr:hypothetical protein RchiOBHm_Chr1g0369161 [Rosa chinensis]